MVNRSSLAVVLIILTLTSGLMPNNSNAAPVGVRIYVDAWNPLHPADPSFQTFYDDPTIISTNITDAWNNVRGDATSDIEQAMAEHNISGGFRTYNATVVLNPIADFSISPTRGGGAVVQFTVPQISIATSFRTPGPAPSGTDPRFSVSGDLVVSVDLEFGGSGKILRTASISTVIHNLQGPTPLNDSAKAINDAADIANAMVDFVTGIDFEKSMESILTSQDLTKKRLQPLIDANLAALDSKFEGIPNVDLLLARTVWADRNRLTLYVAPRPIPFVPQTGTMSGQISWNPGTVTGRCQDLNISAHVQTGPPPLLNSDGVTFGPAPVVTVGSFSVDAIGPTVCSYSLTQLGSGFANALWATTSLGSANPHGSTSPYVGRLHSTTTIMPVGWNGDFVVPDAVNRNYTVVSSDTAGTPVGKLKPEQMRPVPDPGDERGATPGVSNQISNSPAATVELNPQPLPPKIGAVGAPTSKTKLNSKPASPTDVEGTTNGPGQ